MSFYEVERDSDEWHRMWSELASAPMNSGDSVCECTDTHECWQYMGTFEDKHSFRHRNHPVTGKREYLEIPAL